MAHRIPVPLAAVALIAPQVAATGSCSGTVAELTSSTFDCTVCLDIDINDNVATEIPSGAFDTCTAVTSINFESSSIVKLPFGFLDNMPLLDFFGYFPDNIEELPRNFFKNNPLLTSIEGYPEKLRIIDSNLLAFTPILEYFDFTECENLDSPLLPWGFFDHVPLLTSMGFCEDIECDPLQPGPLQPSAAAKKKIMEGEMWRCKSAPGGSILPFRLPSPSGSCARRCGSGGWGRTLGYKFEDEIEEAASEEDKYFGFPTGYGMGFQLMPSFGNFGGFGYGLGGFGGGFGGGFAYGFGGFNGFFPSPFNRPRPPPFFPASNPGPSQQGYLYTQDAIQTPYQQTNQQGYNRCMWSKSGGCRCSCDDACFKKGDCCLDYPTQCKGKMLSELEDTR